MSIFYTRHDGGLTLMKDGKQSTVSSDHQNFVKILTALKAKQWDEVEALMSLEKMINKTGTSRKHPGCKVYVQNGKVYFTDTRNRKEVKLHGTLVDRILTDLGKPGCEKYADALMALLENIRLNKLKDVANELYEWLASGKAPITNDGCILAYKKVCGDYLDQHSRTMDNSPGKVVRIPQADVDPDRRNECSRGLHFASLGYLNSYSAGSHYRVMIVKVNPRHIFAIPRDYNCQKGRASEYYVVGEYKGKNNQTEEAFNNAFIDEDNKVQSAPNVEFVKTGLRPSLEAIAESYSLVVAGKVWIEVVNGKYVALPQDGNDSHDEVYEMSFKTKSVREAVKQAVAKMEKKR